MSYQTWFCWDYAAGYGVWPIVWTVLIILNIWLVLYVVGEVARRLKEASEDKGEL